MNIVLVGPLASGKTAIADKLIEKEIANFSDYYSVEMARREHSDGTYAGEMDAWAKFLRKIQDAGGNGIFEFSGTGRNVWNVSEAMRDTISNRDQKWMVVYVLADESVLIDRALQKTYDAPCPYELNDPRASIKFMNTDLKKTYENSRSWASAPKIVVRSDMKDIDAAADQIINAINEIQ